MAVTKNTAACAVNDIVLSGFVAGYAPESACIQPSVATFGEQWNVYGHTKSLQNRQKSAGCMRLPIHLLNFISTPPRLPESRGRRDHIHE